LVWAIAWPAPNNKTISKNTGVKTLSSRIDKILQQGFEINLLDDFVLLKQLRAFP
jgi:hypothetical protein